MDFKNVDWNKAVEDSLANLENAKGGSGRKQVDLKKYFTPSLSDGADSGEKSIRILPLDETGRWYDVVKFHEVKLGKDYVKLYDPAQDGEESPLNDVHKILSNGSEEEKKMARSYRSRDFYIVRLIERGKEHEGVKIWRFKKLYDGSGIMDKIEPIMKHYGAFFNPVEGRDLVISVKKDPTKKNYTKPVYVISAIMAGNTSPLSSDNEQIMTWLNDSATWRDRYAKKSVEYLRIVAQGDVPVWDTKLNKYVGANSVIDSEGSGEGDYDSESKTEAPVELGTYFNKMPSGSDSNFMDSESGESDLMIDEGDLPF